jgi:hypothetical protein
MTRLALMQPYLFPYLGSFSLIAATDRYVVFDNVQYIRRGWMHRNRIHKPGGGWQYISVSVEKAPRHTPIHEIRLSTSVDWRQALRDSVVGAYRGVAPRLEAVLELVSRISDPAHETLADLSVHAMAEVCAELGLPFDPVRATDIGLAKASDQPAWGWAVDACRRCGADQYVNPPGGADLYPPGPFTEAGLQVGILRPDLPPYGRAEQPWEAGLSVLDALAFQSPSAVRERVDAFSIDWRTPA